MQSRFALVLEQFFGFFERHQFADQVVVERTGSKYFEETVRRSAEFELRLCVDFRGEISVGARPIGSKDDWYEVPILLEMMVGVTPFILDEKNVATLVSCMTGNYDLLARFFSLAPSEIRAKYGLWVEGSYWASVLKARK
jgi:hypothetical protein